jgi:GntR family transcriptional regulator
MRIQINRSSPIPLYIQLKQSIESLMEANQLTEGMQLPSEEELVSMTGLSRHTVRQALQELETEGRIERRHGKGTFVSERRISLSIACRLIGFWTDLAMKGYRVESRVLEQSVIPAAENIAAALGIAPGSPVVYLKRFRRVNGQPFLIDWIYIPEAVCPGLDAVNMNDTSLLRVLEERYGLKIVRSQRKLHAVQADAESASQLQVEQGVPLFLLTDLSFAENGEAVEIAYSLVHGTKSEFQFDLTTSTPIVEGSNPLPKSG